MCRYGISHNRIRLWLKLMIQLKSSFHTSITHQIWSLAKSLAENCVELHKTKWIVTNHVRLKREVSYSNDCQKPVNFAPHLMFFSSWWHETILSSLAKNIFIIKVLLFVMAWNHLAQKVMGFFFLLIGIFLGVNVNPVLIFGDAKFQESTSKGGHRQG